jgi:hypothetical protein
MGIDNAFGNLLAIFLGAVVFAFAFTAADRLFNLPWKPRPRRKK